MVRNKYIELAETYCKTYIQNVSKENERLQKVQIGVKLSFLQTESTVCVFEAEMSRMIDVGIFSFRATDIFLAGTV